MAAALRKTLVYGGVFLLAILLLAEVGSMAGLCVHAFRLNLTQLGYTIPPIVLFVFFVGWLHLHWGRYTRRAFVFSLIVVTASFALLAEIGFMAGLCVYAFELKLTRLEYTIPPIVIFMLVVGWLPLILRRYTRRAFVFSLIVMTASFAVSCSTASALIVTPVRLLKLPAVVVISWLIGGLWGWMIVYLDRQKWRMGEKLGEIFHGRKPAEDARSRRPFVTVIAVSMLAAVVCIGIWVVGREKLLKEVWSESGYRKRLTIAWNLIELNMLIGRPENQVRGYFGQPDKSEEASADGSKALWWSIGVAPPGATSYNAGQKAYLRVMIENGKATDISIEYDPDTETDNHTKAQ
jgi:hypothetical protein